MTVKVGKAVAIAVGGSIILLQIANEQGYIKVNWDKLASKTDKLMDKVEERVTGEGPNMLDKVRIELPTIKMCLSVSWCELPINCGPSLKFRRSLSLQVKTLVSQSKYSSTGFLAGFLIALGLH